ncbi:MAG: hydroxysqualene dehydroxylase HpnE [Candidatus Bipolaricaulota bacterium]|nr:hydroxysqualene dehydroxylase HpnE [Candidatus Bipolaricaulota bacterium]
MSRVVVIGGGFAGMAAACRLANDGVPVALYERAPRLGGRAASFEYEGETLDYGHHILMSCCTAATGFLERLGVEETVRFQDYLSIPILCEGERTVLRSAPLPGILHLLPSLLRYRPLSFGERLAALRAGAALAVGRGRNETFGAWLSRHGQSERAVRRLWNPVVVATLNAPAGKVGIAAARKVLRDGFFQPDGAAMGLFTVPLGSIFDAARKYVEARGGLVEVGAAASRVLFDGNRVIGVALADGRTVDAEAVICAVPPNALAPLVGPRPELANTLAAASRLEWAPIVNVHLWFDRPILDDEFAIAVDSPVQAIFDLDRLRGQGGGRHLVLSQSAADAWIDRADTEVVGELVAALRNLLRAGRDTRLVNSLVLRHRRATFVPSPGSDALRPGAHITIGGLFLAGDWTATGWPSTIEGAIRSGIGAAARAESETESQPLPASDD